jgi:microcystin-dependent protein
MDEYIGMIKLFAGNFAPQDWAYCNGQIMSIQQFSALYSLLGTAYGGNGTTTFALPDLRGRTPICFGQGAGTSNYPQGATGGVETVTLQGQQLPAHNHALSAAATDGNAALPNTGLLANSTGSNTSGDSITGNIYQTGTPTITNASPNSIGLTGGSQPHDNRPPFMALNYIICLNGLYPSRP